MRPCWRWLPVDGDRRGWRNQARIGAADLAPAWLVRTAVSAQAAMVPGGAPIRDVFRGRLRISGRLVAGAVLVNDTSDFRIDAMPFGGFGRSGIGREGIRHAIEALTEPKSYIVNTMSTDHTQSTEREQEEQ